MTVVKISDCFYNVNNSLCFVMKLAGMICKLDKFLENWQIVKCNLQIGQIGRLDGTYIYIYMYIYMYIYHVLWWPMRASHATACNRFSTVMNYTSN